MSGMQIEDITHAADLEAFECEWWQLWRRCPAATPFQSPAWLIPWWHSFPRGELLVLALRSHERLIGLLPLHRVAQETGCRLLLLGAGTSDVLDLLVQSPFGEEAAQAVLRHVSGKPGACELEPLPAQSPLLGCPAPPGLMDTLLTVEVCPTLVLPRSVEALAEFIPRRMLENLAYCRRRAARNGASAVEQADASSLDGHLEALIRLHAARWSSRGGAGVLADTAVQRFHREAAAALLRDGLLRMYALRIGQRIVASHYGMHAHRRAYFYIGGFDPELAPLGLGTILIGHAIDTAVRERAREFHFLRGGEAYKYRWGATDRPVYARRLAPAGATLGAHTALRGAP